MSKRIRVDTSSVACSIDCPWCEFVAANINGIATHASKKHCVDSRQLYDTLHPDVEHVCACGCGEETSFKSIRDGYAAYLKGHHLRKQQPSDSEAPLCGCGCGESTRWNRHSKTFNTYVHGHAARGRPSPFKGLNKDNCDKFRRQSQTLMADVDERRRRAERVKALHDARKMPRGRRLQDLLLSE